MNTRIIVAIQVFVLCVFLQACAKQKKTVEEASVGPSLITAGDPNAVLSPVLQKIKGRWVKEIDDPMTANPPTMNLYAIADHTLGGRYLVGGGFADTGVAATLKEEGDVFTLTLVDDELRNHEPMPLKRVFTGKYDTEKRELTLRTPDGEFVKWELAPENCADQTGPEAFHCYTAYYTAYIFRCVLIPTPLPSSNPATGGTVTPPTTTIPTLPAGPSGSSGSALRRTRSVFEPLMLASVVPAPAATPSPKPTIPVANLNSCGVMATYHENWSRMSGSD